MILAFEGVILVEMSKIYVIVGSVGEYSDHKEWYVCAFRNQEEAQAFVMAVSAESRDIRNRILIYNQEHPKEQDVWTFLYSSESAPEALKSQLDPDMEMDPDVNYWYEEVELR